MRKAQGLLRLAEKYSPQLVEEAATLALEIRSLETPKAFKKLLEKLKRENREEEVPQVSGESLEFLRDMEYFTRQ